MDRKQKRSHKNKRKGQSILLILFITLLFCIWLWITIIVIRSTVEFGRTPRVTIPGETQTEVIPETERQTEVPEQQSAETEAETETETEVVTEKETETEESIPAPEIAEEAIYTFMQGPKAYKEKVAYGGEWCKKELAGTVFAEFGCGMCCMANLYSTFSHYECSPLDMYYYAQEVTDYSPGGGYGAIAWEYMKKALKKVGFKSELHKKDELYRDFKRNIQKGWAAVCLVSCYNDDSYWTKTPGHYITIWEYDAATETVFLGDSGDPTHNRQRIPLAWVYSAFKTSDKYQYLLIRSYDEEKNTWKKNSITEKWNQPDTYAPKSEESYVQGNDPETETETETSGDKKAEENKERGIE